MDVQDWKHVAEPTTGDSDSARRFWSPAIVGVLGTLLLHSLVLETVQLVGRNVKVTRAVIVGGDSGKSQAESGDTLVLIALPSNKGSDPAAVQNIVSSLPALSKISLSRAIVPDAPAPLSIDSLTLGEEQSSNVAGNSTDGSERARLTGIYSGQIQARIERVWRRPRTPVDETDAKESFQCEAQIVQDNSGYVEGILLPRCNGSSVWQQSLVTAIQQASPLPAPPDPTVFSRSITLSFIGIPYFRGASDDEYEVLSRSFARAEEKN